MKLFFTTVSKQLYTLSILLSTTTTATRLFSTTMSKKARLFNHNEARVALCQIHVTSDKNKNLQHMEELVTSAVQSSTEKPVDIVVLPEVWNSPYGTSFFPVYAEKVPSVFQTPSTEIHPSVSKLCALAQSLGVWIVGGSIPECEDVIVSEEGNLQQTEMKRLLFNTCVIINNEGTIVGKHRKIHLFDIDIPGKMTFKESDSLTAGKQVTVVDTPWGKLGVGICYDMRFPELGMLMRQRGCRFLIYPGAFNMVTGPLHWELLQKARAVDNQLYVMACSPARDTTAGYVAWGHSSVVSPWGDVVSKAGAEEEVVYADLDFEKVTDMRANIPVSNQKRLDVYKLVDYEVENDVA